MSETTYIYLLKHNEDIRYIGKSDNPERRYSQHIKRKSGTVAYWIDSIQTNPQMEIVDEVPIEDWEFWEKHYISLYKSWGYNLLNTYEGGSIFQATKINNNHPKLKRKKFKRNIIEKVGTTVPLLIGIEQERIKLGLTKAQLAKAADITASYYSIILKGKSTVSVKIMENLAKKVGFELCLRVIL